MENPKMTDANRAIMASFLNPDPRSVGVLNAINAFYPAFAQKIFQNNPLMKKIVMSGYNPMSILDYPICGRCETLAAWSDTILRNNRRVRTCGCLAEKCGQITINPVTFRVWMADELRHKVPNDFKEYIEYAVDAVAMQLMRRAYGEINLLQKKAAPQQQEEMGVVPDGEDQGQSPDLIQPYQREKATVTFEEKHASIADEMQRIREEVGMDEKPNY